MRSSQILHVFCRQRLKFAEGLDKRVEGEREVKMTPTYLSQATERIKQHQLKQKGPRRREGA